MLKADYRDGFAIVLDITLCLGYTCQLRIKVKRMEGLLRLEFRREPFSHWLVVFQNEPLVDLDVKFYLCNSACPPLAQIIAQQIRRTLRNKQTWPSYKIRCQPFFPTSTASSVPSEILSQGLISGTYDVSIKHCDRLSIPFDIFHEEKRSFLPIFLTVNINEQSCGDLLHVDRHQWPVAEFDFLAHLHTMDLQEVIYMGRKELLIRTLDPIPTDLDDAVTLRAALDDKNLFLLQIDDQIVTTLKQANRLLTDRSIDEKPEKRRLVVGMPLLNSLQVSRIAATRGDDVMVNYFNMRVLFDCRLSDRGVSTDRYNEPSTTNTRLDLCSETILPSFGSNFRSDSSAETASTANNTTIEEVSSDVAQIDFIFVFHAQGSFGSRPNHLDHDEYRSLTDVSSSSNSHSTSGRGSFRHSTLSSPTFHSS